jgi:hypothetical protein
MTGLLYLLIVDQHLSSDKQSLRLLAAFRAATFDQEVVYSPLRHRGGSSGH